MDPRVEIERLRQEMAALREEFRAVSSLGMRLASALDPVALLPSIVSAARHLSASEAGSLYVRRDNRLVFEVAQNDAKGRGHDDAPGAAPEPLPRIELALDGSSLAGLAASERRILNIADARSHVAHSKDAESKFNYEVISMLVVPMVDHRDEVLGVLQLMNSRDAGGSIVPYTEHQAYVCEVLASHAATAMEIARLYSELTNVFDSLVRYSTASVDARDPCTAGHSSRVGSYAMQVARKMGGFSDAELREIRFAGIFHDIGKIGVRECVLTKSDKISPEGMLAIEARIAAACEAAIRAAALEGAVEPGRLRAAALLDDLAFIREINDPKWLPDEALARLEELGGRTWRDWQGADRALLLPGEVESLSVRKGNLTDVERREIESHARLSREFLMKIPFSKDLARVPLIAGSHHEKLDGSGYPLGLKGDEIIIQSRIVAVVDVFDALTAEDRPYKKAMSAPKALAILEHEAEGGAFDREVVAVLRTLVEGGRFVPRSSDTDIADEAAFDPSRDAWR